MQNLWRIDEGVDVDLASVLKNFMQDSWQMEVDMNLSRTQIGIAQSCQAERTGHDTYHILYSYHEQIHIFKPLWR